MMLPVNWRRFCRESRMHCGDEERVVDCVACCYCVYYHIIATLVLFVPVLVSFPFPRY